MKKKFDRSLVTTFVNWNDFVHLLFFQNDTGIQTRSNKGTVREDEFFKDTRCILVALCGLILI